MTSLTLPLAARCIGQRISQLALPNLDVRVVSLRRSDGKVVSIAQDPLIEDNDTLVLCGRAEALALAEQKLLTG